MFSNGSDHHGMIVTERERPSPTKAIHEHAPIDVADVESLSPPNRYGQLSRIASGIGFSLRLAVQILAS
jgi:hypothetical protein